MTRKPPENSAAPDELGLLDFLAERARGASDLRLTLNAMGGLSAVAAVALLRPPAWLPLASAGVCFAAYGAWGILDRELGERAASISGAGRVTLHTGRIVAGTLGATAVLALLFSLLALALGNWIS